MNDSTNDNKALVYTGIAITLLATIITVFSAFFLVQSHHGIKFQLVLSILCATELALGLIFVSSSSRAWKKDAVSVPMYAGLFSAVIFYGVLVLGTIFLFSYFREGKPPRDETLALLVIIETAITLFCCWLMITFDKNREKKNSEGNELRSCLYSKSEQLSIATVDLDQIKDVAPDIALRLDQIKKKLYSLACLLNHGGARLKESRNIDDEMKRKFNHNLGELTFCVKDLIQSQEKQEKIKKIEELIHSLEVEAKTLDF